LKTFGWEDIVDLHNLFHLRETFVEHGTRSFLKKAKGAFTSKRAEQAKAQPTPSLEETCDHLLVLVDRQNTLPESYVPRDLVSLRSYGIHTLGVDMLLWQEAAEHLSQLVAAASAVGEKLMVTSAYRSFQDQQAVFARTAFTYEGEAGSYSALPGQSQHQLGTTVDFTSEAANYRLWKPFEDASAARWLLEHASDYGFVLSYPKGGEAETGYEAEPWHYRYIGVENARRMRDSELSLHAFLLREGILPRQATAEPLESPAPSNTLEELRSRLPRISGAHAGTQGVAIFDPYSGETVSLNADRRFIAASLGKLYVLLTLYKAAARGEVDLDDEITMRPSDVWTEGTGVLYTYPRHGCLIRRAYLAYSVPPGMRGLQGHNVAHLKLAQRLLETFVLTVLLCLLS
jgi:zinc D-Ala-D-Ala carboxypeptidase